MPYEHPVVQNKKEYRMHRYEGGSGEMVTKGCLEKVIFVSEVLKGERRPTAGEAKEEALPGREQRVRRREAKKAWHELQRPVVSQG